jgi:predicted phosphoribosyltransferase/dienelactone hydrolase
MFSDRTDAGRRLAPLLTHLRGTDALVLGLPRGGVPVAFEVAAELQVPLDVLLVRKLGVPFQPELAMGAIGEGGVRVLDERILRHAGVSAADLAAIEQRERTELDRRAALYRAGRRPASLHGRVAIVVDDGIATGSTAAAACRVARAQGAARVVLAVPVAPVGWERRFSGVADEVVCVATPEPFFGIGRFYDDFAQTADEEVLTLLHRAAAPPQDDEVVVTSGTVPLGGRLIVPVGAAGVVVFVHGSGSSRHSPRNRQVARTLQDAGLATLLFDLLTTGEEHDRAAVFDVERLGRRLAEVTRWLVDRPHLTRLPVGYFGASTGAAAALWAATEPDLRVGAVVSRGGRPDLAGERLERVEAPTLLLVGGRDLAVLDLNERARARMHGTVRIEVVPGATHLFEEPGTLETVAGLARDWFLRYLV